MKPSRKLLLVYLITPCFQLVLCSRALLAQTPQFSVPVTIAPDQFLTCNPTPKGGRIPDFSTVGYNYGNSPLPDPSGHSVNQPVAFLSAPRVVEPCFLDRAALG